MGTLYVVGTPIGNLEDLSLRAARILGEVGLVAAEDTRVTRRLLNHLGLRARVVSYNDHNHRQRLPQVLAALEEYDVALVSDAGMPGVSDPGRELVSEAAAMGFRVETVPGPSAVTTALATSGFSGDSFVFLGFLPRRRRERQEALKEGASTGQTLVAFEAPHRVRTTLAELASVLGERPIAVCRELTKLHEEVFRGTPSQALGHFIAPRGEFVIVVGGVPPTGEMPESAGPVRELDIIRQLAALRTSGVRSRDAVAQAAQIYGISKNRAYQFWLASRHGESDTPGDGV